MTLPDSCLSACERLSVALTEQVLVIRISTQRCQLFTNSLLASEYPCSTSRFGTGQQGGSNCTPLGLHCIAEKIGAGAPAGTVFKGRVVVGHTSDPKYADAKITTRIMWLEGLEPGFNRGGTVDTHARYVYIHGTADQTSIGQPVTSGCTHLADPVLIELFDLLPAGTLVWIE